MDFFNNSNQVYYNVIIINDRNHLVIINKLIFGIWNYIIAPCKLLICSSVCSKMKTSRERHKSASYLRLKNSTMTLKCQVFSSTVPEKPKRAELKGLKGGTLRDF